MNALEPHTTAVTGDVVDVACQIPLAEITHALAKLPPCYGSLVTGNHEYYSGAHAWIEEFRALGLQF